MKSKSPVVATHLPMHLANDVTVPKFPKLTKDKLLDSDVLDLNNSSSALSGAQYGNPIYCSFLAYRLQLSA